MKKLLILLMIFLFTVSANAVPLFEKKLKVITTSPYTASIVKDICGNKIIAKNIFFYSSPSEVLLPWYQENYEVDAKTIKDISNSNVVLYHSWQTWIRNLKYRISKFGIVYHELKTSGSLMVPETNLKLAKEITSLFSIWNGNNKEFYEKNFGEYNNKVDSVVKEIEKNKTKFKDIKIVCNKSIVPFMVRLGFNVVAEYRDTDYVSEQDIKYLKKKIKEENIKYIVDCLQGGTDIGRKLSEELNIKHIVVSNIPLASSYVKTLKKNCEIIFETISN